MTKIEIFSGFLGAGKTTLIKKLLDEAFKGEKLVLIENEFGEIGIDGGFLKEAGIQISEMNSGCICCSLVGDFGEALKKVVDEFAPDRILIEPSGVGKLSDVIRAVERTSHEVPMELGSAVTVVNAQKSKMYLKNFGEFFLDQVEHAGTIVLSRTADLSDEKLEQTVSMLKEHNPKAAMITTPWDQIDGKQILAAMQGHTLLEQLLEEARLHRDDEEHEHHHHHDDKEHEHHHHHHDDEEHDHRHHHEDEEHEHHHHDHEEHEHHHHHDADEIFQSWGRETTRKYSKEELETILKELDSEKYGAVLRAKGIVEASDAEGWYHFDYVPGEQEVRFGASDYTGLLCVIGSELKEDLIEQLFCTR